MADVDRGRPKTRKGVKIGNATIPSQYRFLAAWRAGEPCPSEADAEGNVHICGRHSPERDHYSAVFIHYRFLAAGAYPVFGKERLALCFGGEVAGHGRVVNVGIEMGWGIA